MRDTGLSLSTVLLVVFVVLKVLGVITWSWVWVLSPFWLPCLLGLCFLVGAAVAAWLLS